MSCSMCKRQIINAGIDRVIIRTGETEKVMDDIARISQENLDNQIGQILSAIEPTLVIALSLIVGVILLSVMFPLMGIMSGI